MSVSTNTINSPNVRSIAVQHTPIMRHQSTFISPKRIFNSPTKIQLRKFHLEEIKLLRRKLYDATYNEKKARKKICSLKTVLNELQKRNLITESDYDVLQHLNEGTEEIVKRELRKQKGLPVSRKYNCNLRKFALSLHFYSPRAYNFVQYKFYVLPHAKTISKWYRLINGEAGIMTEALNAIKLHVQSVSYRLIGTLIFDEMAIRQQIDYFKGQFIGYVDCGNYIECDSTKVAKEALVFCVVCMNQV